MAWAPNPPGFYKQFTSANIERLAELRKEHSNSNDEASKFLTLPPELRYLNPPEPPADGNYSLFGISRSIHQYLAPLASMEIQQVFPSDPPLEEGDAGTTKDWTLDRGMYLKNMSRSILLSFMELAGILSRDPKQAERKLTDIKTLFLNTHYLINEYRPHQARESLILKLEEDIERGKNEVEEVKRLRQKVDRLMSANEVEVDESETSKPSVEESHGKQDSIQDEQKVEHVQRAIWDFLDRDPPR